MSFLPPPPHREIPSACPGFLYLLFSTIYPAASALFCAFLPFSNTSLHLFRQLIQRPVQFHYIYLLFAEKTKQRFLGMHSDQGRHFFLGYISGCCYPLALKSGGGDADMRIKAACRCRNKISRNSVELIFTVFPAASLPRAVRPGRSAWHSLDPDWMQQNLPHHSRHHRQPTGARENTAV